MKNSMRWMVLSLAVMSVMSAYAQDGVTLRRTFKNGDVEKYTINTIMNSVTDLSSMGQGEQSFSLTSKMDAAYTYSNVKEDGTASVAFLFNNIEMKIDGPMAEMMGGGGQTPSEMKGSGTIDPFGKITGIKMEGNSANMMQMMGGSSSADLFSFIQFPYQAIAVGGTWDFELPQMGMFAKGSKLTGKLVGEIDFKGRKAWNLEFSGKPAMSMDIGRMMQDNPQAQDSGMPPMNIIMEGTNTIILKVVVDQKSGQVLSASSVSEMSAMVKLPEMGFEFPVSGDTTMTMTLRD